MQKNKVAVLQCDSYDVDKIIEKLNKGAELLGGWSQWLKPGMNVLLKVNMISPLPPESAAVTHCELVRAVVRIVKQYGCNVWIGDSSGGAMGRKSQTAKCFVIAGFAKVAGEEGAEIKNFDTDGVVEIKTSSGEIMHLAKPLFDADFIINLPKFKTHMFTGFTGAYKNLFGSVPGLKKAEYHKTAQDAESFGGVLYEINKAVKPGLHIIDGILAMDKQGPVGGRVYKADKILMGTDPLAVDSVALKMIDLNINDLPFFVKALEQMPDKKDLDAVQVCGDFSSAPKLPDFKVPMMFMSKSRKSKLFGKMIEFMKKEPEMDMKKCKNCNVCVNSCPMEAIDKETKKIDYSKCIRCMCCHEMCVYKAIKLVNTNRFMRTISVWNK